MTADKAVHKFGIVVRPLRSIRTRMSQQVESNPTEGTMSTDGNPIPELREHDVVCEKGRGDHERWPGNRLYRSLINNFKDSYNDLAPVERSSIIGSIASTIKDKNGWFVQRDETSGKWCELSEEKVRKKVSDDLRREVRRRREKRSNSTMFSAKLKALKEMEEDVDNSRDILQPVNDPRQTDVLFGPGARRHPGNKTYWRLMKMNLDHYIISPYGARSMISRSIVQGIRDQKGRFLEQDPKTAIWYEISDKRAVEKTSHALSNKKYKTRKRHPDETEQHPFKGYNDLEDEESDCSSDKGSEPSHDSEESPTRAKAMSKKFRLLKRMDDPEFDDDDKESIPHAANILVMAFPRATTNTTTTTSLSKKVVDTPASPPTSKDQRVIVSPNDSKSTLSDTSREEYPDYESGFRRVLRRVPSVPEAGLPPPHAFHYHHKAEIEPRLRHYETYVDEDHYNSRRMTYNKAPPSPFVGHMHGDYAPIRRYVDHGPPHLEAEYLSPRAAAHAHHSPSYATGGHLERRILKARSPSGGYWVRDWGSPSTRRADEYNNAWR